MAQFGASIQTAQITTGNFRTTVDPFVSGFAGYPNNPGARNPLGAAYYDATGTASNPYGVPGKYRYVRYLSTANPAPVAGSAVVYWTDATFTTVSGVSSEGFAGTSTNLVAGILMPNTTALTSLTATTLNGNFVWIAVGGYVAGVAVPAGTAANGPLVAATGNFLLSTTAAAGNRIVGYATTAVAGGLSNLLVTLES